MFDADTPTYRALEPGHHGSLGQEVRTQDLNRRFNVGIRHILSTVRYQVGITKWFIAMIS